MRTLGWIAAAALASLAATARPHGHASLAVTSQAGGATLTGTVKFAGSAPTNPAIDMSEEPQCASQYKTTPRDPIVVVNSNGTLANVLVYVKSGLAADAKYDPPTTPFVIDQRGCEYHPRVFGIMVNQPLEIRNSDPLMHNIKTMSHQNRPFNISQPTAGMKLDRSFATPEAMVPFECNVHGWMHAYAAVLPHPFFAVTGTDGTFGIKGLPPGTYTIEAWHEKYGSQTATVTVQGTETKTADFSYTGQ
jgi:hypothetical protein